MFIYIVHVVSEFAKIFLVFVEGDASTHLPRQNVPRRVPGVAPATPETSAGRFVQLLLTRVSGNAGCAIHVLYTTQVCCLVAHVFHVKHSLQIYCRHCTCAPFADVLHNLQISFTRSSAYYTHTGHRRCMI